jgi:hypothetical protein
MQRSPPPFRGGGMPMHMHDEGINQLDFTVENRCDLILHPIPSARLPLYASTVIGRHISTVAFRQITPPHALAQILEYAVQITLVIHLARS